MKHIRIATAEEVEAIKDHADLLPGRTTVLALDNDNGGADIAVLRNPFELNPIIWDAKTTDRRRWAFLYALEERLLGAGVDRYYFQLAADEANEDYRKTAEHWGAQRVSPHPEFRYLKVIT